MVLSKAALSGSTNGRAIKVAATSTPGTAIHTATALTGDDNYDEIWLWAMNTDSSDRKLTIEFGGQSAPDDLQEKTITLEGGLILIVPGLILNNSLAITAFAAAANVVTILGYVNQIRRT